MTLKEKYRPVLTGFFHYDWPEELLKRHEGMLDHVLSDRRACEKCDGEDCLTSINDPYSPVKWKGFMELSHRGAKLYNRPCEQVRKCPGPDERKQRILDSMKAPESVLAGGKQWEGN